MTSWRNGASTRFSVGRERGLGTRADECQLAGGRGVDDGFDERRLERVGLLVRVPPVPLAHRLLDRLARSRPTQVLDAHVVREQARDLPLEAVELCERVFPDRQQEVNPEVRLVDDRRERLGEGALALLVRVVEEVVLELVEDDEQRAHALGPGAEGVLDGGARAPGVEVAVAERLVGRRPDRLHQGRQGSSRQAANAHTAKGARSGCAAGRLRASGAGGRGRRLRARARSCRPRSRRRGASAATRGGCR